MAKKVSADQLRSAIVAVSDWLLVDESVAEKPSRSALAAAVRASAQTLAQIAPGHAVEVRIPPYAAVQCIAGTTHTRGTPPNVVEMDARNWLLLVVGRQSWQDADLECSGTQAAEVAEYLPLVSI
ncbi:sterol carrier family protein [Corynebacterium ulceribovis]|uniref:sterol carrier family protein n=1 Tax=Corynebacterium ulceribovis TaxID=487732 RepID=UPI00036FD8CB|nr:sterol carrier family protein [Corynebacterium ulceribovis]